MVRLLSCGLLIGALSAGAAPLVRAQGQNSDATSFANNVATDYAVDANVTYHTISGMELKLDFYWRQNAAAPVPTVIFFHGGGYRLTAKKEGSILDLMPWIQRGWNAVNVEYRPIAVAQAPAALEDTRCALRWVVQNAKKYKVDTNRVVISGQSAGGHLALATGVVPETAGFDQNCPGGPIKVAGIVNWYGVWDVRTLVDGPMICDRCGDPIAKEVEPTRGHPAFMIMWLGGNPNRAELAARLSPITYVRAGMPPVISIHGDADTSISHEQAVRGTAAVKAAGGTTRLVTIPGGGHGNFEAKEVQRAWSAIDEFLAANIGATSSASQSAAR